MVFVNFADRFEFKYHYIVDQHVRNILTNCLPMIIDMNRYLLLNLHSKFTE